MTRASLFWSVKLKSLSQKVSKAELLLPLLTLKRVSGLWLHRGVLHQGGVIGPCPGTSNEIRTNLRREVLKMDLVDLVIQLLIHLKMHTGKWCTQLMVGIFMWWFTRCLGLVRLWTLHSFSLNAFLRWMLSLGSCLFWHSPPCTLAFLCAPPPCIATTTTRGWMMIVRWCDNTWFKRRRIRWYPLPVYPLWSFICLCSFFKFLILFLHCCQSQS